MRKQAIHISITPSKSKPLIDIFHHKIGKFVTPKKMTPNLKQKSKNHSCNALFLTIFYLKKVSWE